MEAEMRLERLGARNFNSVNILLQTLKKTSCIKRLQKNVTRLEVVEFFC